MSILQHVADVCCTYGKYTVQLATVGECLRKATRLIEHNDFCLLSAYVVLDELFFILLFEEILNDGLVIRSIKQGRVDGCLVSQEGCQWAKHNNC